MLKRMLAAAALLFLGSTAAHAVSGYMGVAPWHFYPYQSWYCATSICTPGAGSVLAGSTTLDDGKAVVSMDVGVFYSCFSILISGFSSDPGSSYMNGVYFNNTCDYPIYSYDYQTSSASAYSYNSGVARWTWNTGVIHCLTNSH